ncbi:unnamed protein product [Nesidiocoris tenuis]|uniref:Uncharacterized protein n=1 Tax=Nesidiocoris tenuis TaxID=355587 RepID=A0A6H5HNM9_9HEMI|nr:unnamed protein product [Nesidiocoris tenuis]
MVCKRRKRVPTEFKRVKLHFRFTSCLTLSPSLGISHDSAHPRGSRSPKPPPTPRKTPEEACDASFKQLNRKSRWSCLGNRMWRTNGKAESFREICAPGSGVLITIRIKPDLMIMAICCGIRR